jgi:hypothetical protein
MLITQKILFSKEECQSIIYGSDNITNWGFLKDRKFHSQPIIYSLETKWLFDKLKKIFEEQTNIQIKKDKEIIHFHKFVKGDWFGKHNDTRDKRLFAVGVLLNDDFEGGDFKLYNPNEIILDKVIGNTYLFDVRIYHEITQILNDERYSLLWFLQQENIKIERNKLI